MNKNTRKLMWSVPLIAAVAVIGALAAFMTLTPNPAAAQDAEMLGPPTGLTATADGQSKIKLQWTGPAGQIGYRVDVAKDDDGAVWEELEPANSGYITSIGNIGRYTHTGLDAGSKRHYRVFAIDSTGDEGMPSASVSATTALATKSASPRELSVVPVTDTIEAHRPAPDQITLEWQEPPVNGGSDITAYKIQHSKTGAGAWSDLKTLLLIDEDLIPVAASSPPKYRYIVKGLAEETTSHYRVIAINEAGESDPSSVVSGKTTDATDLGAVTLLQAQGNDSQVTLYWKAPADPPGAPVTGYKIERSTDGTGTGTGAWNVIANNTGSRATSYQAGGAVHSTTDPTHYHYQVTPINADAPVSGTSDTVNLNVDNEGKLPATAKGPVKSLLAKATGRGSIRLTWELPAGGTDDTTYTVFASKDGRVWSYSGVSGAQGASGASTDESFTFQTTTENPVAIKANERWYFLVFAVTGTTDKYHKVSSRPASAKTAPAETPAAVQGLTAAVDSEKPGSQINLTITLDTTGTPAYDNGGAKVTGFQIRRSTNQITWETIAANFNHDDDATPAAAGEPRTYEYYDKKLAAGTAYYYEVRAINSVGVGAVMRTSATTTGAPALGAPTGLVAVARSGAEVDLYWNSPGDPDGDPIKGYWIQVSEDSGTNWSNVASDTMSKATTHTHMGVPAGKTLTYRVSAINSGGSGTASINEEVMTPAAMAPDAPTVAAAAASHTQINVSWEEPADNGSAITGYVLQRKMGTMDYMTIAATDAATWWNTLDCPMMNDAVPADSDPAPGADDATSPYCAMYGDLMANAKMVVDTTFMANYDTITGMSYMDMGLMANTMYDYRVAAMNGIDKGAYGMASATTQMVPNQSPVPTTDPGMVLPNSVRLIVGGADRVITLTGSFTDPDEGDTVSYTAAVMPADDSIATASVSADGTMLTIAAVAAGDATVTVTASDGNGGTATHDISVTVAGELTAPTITGTNPVGSGIVLVSWNPVASATGYSLIATNLTDSTAPTHTAAAQAGSRSGQIQGLTVGDEYLIFVGAFNDDLAFMLSDFVKVKVE